MSALHLRSQHRPAPVVHRTSNMAQRPVEHRCDCGKPVSHTVAFVQFNSSGGEFVNHLSLCADCYQLILAEDSGVVSVM